MLKKKSRGSKGASGPFGEQGILPKPVCQRPEGRKVLQGEGAKNRYRSGLLLGSRKKAQLKVGFFSTARIRGSLSCAWGRLVTSEEK